jgi:hypothetical protein
MGARSVLNAGAESGQKSVLCKGFQMTLVCGRSVLHRKIAAASLTRVGLRSRQTQMGEREGREGRFAPS